MAWNQIRSGLQPPKDYELRSAEFWEGEAKRYLELARQAEGRSRRIRYALDKHDQCRIAASNLRRLTQS